jgi:hypothetical protein
MVDIRELNPSDNADMLEILENSPMKTSALELHFDKSPDIFLATALWSANFKYYGIFSERRLVGFGMYLIYSGFVMRRYEKIVYVGNFCIDAKYRRRGFLHKLSEHIYQHVPDDCTYGYCMILKGNKRAERYFEQGSNILPFLPSKRIKIEYETRSLLILGRKKESPHFEVRQAAQMDIPLLNDFISIEQKPKFLMREATSETIERRLFCRTGLKIEDYYVAYLDKQIIGFCAAWDVSNFKRTRILKYKKRFKVVRMIYKLLSLLNHYPDLPKDGDLINEVYLADLVIKESNHLVLKSLLKVIYNVYHKKNYNLINIGSYKDDPLLKATKSFFFTSLHSNIYFSELGEDNGIDAYKINRPSIDIAML